jgi:hypothetical protein
MAHICKSSKIGGCKQVNARLTAFLGNGGPYENGAGLSFCSPRRFLCFAICVGGLIGFHKAGDTL